MRTMSHTTGITLPPEAIQRVLFIAPKVHVYNIPPLTSTKGYVAASWTADPRRQIFTARLRVIETAIPSPSQSGSSTDEDVSVDVVLEDPSSGQLFAASPYTTPAMVEQVLDSSRFFAMTVRGEGNRKAVLGIGFEERSEAFDFSVVLQEARKTLGLTTRAEAKGLQREKEKGPLDEKRDFSLKEGETITVNLGNKLGKPRGSPRGNQETGTGGGFSLPAPPSGAFLPPPPSAEEVKVQKRLSQTLAPEQLSAAELGFDDGEFGEFQ